MRRRLVVGTFSGLFYGIGGLVALTVLTHLVLFGPNKPLGPNVFTTDDDVAVIDRFTSSAAFSSNVAPSEVASEPAVARATWDYDGQISTVWEGVIPWLPSDPPERKYVVFRVTLFDKETGDTRNLFFAAHFTNPGDALLGFAEVTDEDTIRISGLG